MAKVGIAVFAWKRARFLYVTLDSVSRCDYISETPVKVFVDGGLNAEELQKIKGVSSAFPQFSFVFREKNYGNLMNISCGIEAMFGEGLDEVIFLEDDFIVTEDIIWYSQTLPRDACFINLSWRKVDYSNFFFPRGNLIQSEKFKRLKEWVDQKRYYGVPLTDGRIPIPVGSSKVAECDAVYRLYLIDQNEKAFFPDEYKVACFGCVSDDENCSSALQPLVDAMFEGDKTQWLDNIVGLLKNPPPEGVHEIHWWPRGFRYYPMERLDGWSIGSVLYYLIRDILPRGKRILELGSGFGTKVLSEHYLMHSIEQSKAWVGHYESSYIHAPLVNGWYDRNAIAEKAPERYDLLLIGGPVGKEVKGKILENLDLFNLDSWIIYDGLHREEDMQAHRILCDKLGRAHGEYLDHNKAFGIICPAGMDNTTFDSRIAESNLVPMQGNVS